MVYIEPSKDTLVPALKKPIFLFLCLFLGAFTLTAEGSDLISVYHRALKFDPAFQAAKARLEADKKTWPINLAPLLPQLNIIADTADNRRDVKESPSIPLGVTHFNSNGYTVTLSQQIIDFQNWMRVSQAGAIVKQAIANYYAALQNLIIRTSRAYFAVLEAKDNLNFAIAEKRAFARQLDQTNQRYKVGLIAITAVHEAKASYDSSTASAIAAENALANRREDLRAITGKLYTHFNPLKTRIPLIPPRPNRIDDWVRNAYQYNFELLAARQGTLAAKDNIKIQAGGYLPTVGAVASTDYLKDNPGTGTTRTQIESLSLQLNWDLIQGGLTTARTRQALDLYHEAVSNEELARRVAENETRQAFLAIISGVSQVKADDQAVVSNESALEGTEAAFKVGTRTMVDVLTAQRDVSRAKRNLARDKYTYINARLGLKQAAGTLEAPDLLIINKWLSHRPISLETGLYRRTRNGHTSPNKHQNKKPPYPNHHIQEKATAHSTNTSKTTRLTPSKSKPKAKKLAIVTKQSKPHTTTHATSTVKPKTILSKNTHVGTK